MESSASTYLSILGLGSNLGAREAFLRAGLLEIERHPEIEIEAFSNVYLTEPMGPAQPEYLNMAVRVRTSLAPEDLLQVALGAEGRVGRVRDEKWGPRVLDVDVLWAEGHESHSSTLSLPHQGLFDRAFALGPLLDVFPDAPRSWNERLDKLGGRPPVSWPWRKRAASKEQVWCWGVDELDAVAEALNRTLEPRHAGPPPGVLRLSEPWNPKRIRLAGLTRLFANEVDGEFLTLMQDHNSIEMLVFGTLGSGGASARPDLELEIKTLSFGAEARLVQS